ncbi:T5SS/PEP-CTERM-associated repeat protein/autotransporter-associated beta strand protein, partial [Bosea sp. OAE752]|uniref:beta strand repeat-containing protein n=1 Tax=Bosea sp. OAE752 TaxID=2663873 RepID=UPI003D20EC79
MRNRKKPVPFLAGRQDGINVPVSRRRFIHRLLATTSALALAQAFVVIVAADAALGQSWTGTANTDWTNSANWTGGVPINGTVTINTPSNPAILGVNGAATGTTGNLSVGNGGTGNLTIQNGSTLTTIGTAFSYIGVNGSVGTMTVTGPGSKWILSGSPAVSLILGQTETASSGTLNITNGGSVSTPGDFAGGNATLNVTSGGTLTTGRDAYIGRLPGSNGTAAISGSGSQWMIARRLVVGNGGTGALTISNNAIVDVGTTTTVGDSASSGTLTVASGGVLQTQSLLRGTGPTQVNFDGGTLRAKIATTSFISGFSGTELNIASGGLTLDTAGFNVTASSPFSGTGAFTKIGAGTLTLTGSNSTNFSGVMAINEGTLSVGAATNLGTGGLSFDGGTLQNTGAFTTTLPVTLNAGGGTVQTDANLTLNGVIDGAGRLTKTGSSTLTLSAANTYTGQTWIQSGTLALSGAASVANSARVVADGTFDISAVTPAGASIRSLAGGGTVALGAKTLTLTNANDTFAGSITGAGGLTVSAGTETLTGMSNYTGATNVSGTGTLQLLNGGQITGTSGFQVGQLNSSATATVSGTGSLLQTTGGLVVGLNTGSNATLNVLNGGVVRTAGAATLGGLGTQTGAINVDGAGSLLDVGGLLGVGSVTASTKAFLNVTNGGAIHSASGTVGTIPSASGTKSVLISGSGSSWTMSGAFNLQSNASVSVLNGGTVNAATSTIGSSLNGGTANLLVSGVGSAYLVTGNAVVGAGSGKGFITLADGARMAVGGQLTLASSAGATGVLNLGSGEGQAASGAGMLDAATLAFGPGTGRLNFNHTDAGYV